MLGDETIYQCLKLDPTPSLEKMNKELLSLNRTGMLPDTVYEKLRSSVEVTSRIYGLPKVHKPQVPLRPIMSFVISTTYKLSKYLTMILSPLIGKRSSYIRNSEVYMFTRVDK